MKSFKAVSGILVVVLIYFSFPSKSNFEQAEYSIHNLGNTVANVFLLKGEKNILIDAGIPGQHKKLIKKLKKKGIKPGNLDLIIVTHAHYDHAGSANKLSTYFNAPVLIGLADENLFKKGISKDPIIATPQKLLAKFAKLGVKDQFEPLANYITMPEESVYALNPYGFEGQVKEVGGHTPGSLIIELNDGNVFVGDLIRGSFLPLFKQKVRVHLYMDDNPKAFNILKGILDRKPSKIFCGHGGPLVPQKVDNFLNKHQSFYLSKTK